MEGVIDAATRDLLTRSPGIDWTVTEFVRVVDTRLPPRVFLRHCPELADGRPLTPGGAPVHLQLLGSDPAALAANARQALALGTTSLDLNFGCPAKLVNRHDGGASMLRDPERLRAAVTAVHDAVGDTIPGHRQGAPGLRRPTPGTGVRACRRRWRGTTAGGPCPNP